MARFPDYFERFGLQAEAGVEPQPGQSPDWLSNVADVLGPESVAVSVERVDPPEVPDGEPPTPSGGGRPSNLTVDVIAVYVPWHLEPDRWGIYFHQSSLWTYADDLAAEAGVGRLRAAYFAVQTVLEHEFLHFEVEVAATGLEAAWSRPLYAQYLYTQYRAPSPCGAPLEEALATQRELALARSRRLGSAQRLAKALEDNVDGLPGYGDWRLVDDKRDRATAESLLGVRIAKSDGGAHLRLPPALLAERRCVPIRWVHGAAALDLPPGVAKSSREPTIREFETWLSTNFLTSKPGTGDHRDVFDGDRKVTHYDTQGGRRSAALYNGQSRVIAGRLGMTHSVFRDAVINNRRVDPTWAQRQAGP